MTLEHVLLIQHWNNIHLVDSKLDTLVHLIKLSEIFVFKNLYDILSSVDLEKSRV